MDMLGDDLDYGYDDLGDDLTDSYHPGKYDATTLKQRTDTSELFLDFKLQLMGAYKTYETVTGPDGENIQKMVIKKKKNYKAPVNKQGVEDITGIIGRIVNNHTVMGNLASSTEFNNVMRQVSMNIIQDFIAKRTSWDASIEDIKWIISNSITLVHLFLTRSLEHGEAKSIGETIRESIHRENKPTEKASILAKAANWLTRRETH